jgi:hypothetical protein
MEMVKGNILLKGLRQAGVKPVQVKVSYMQSNLLVNNHPGDMTFVFSEF